MKKIFQQLLFVLGISSCISHTMEMELERNIKQEDYLNASKIFPVDIKKIIALYLLDAKHLAQAYKNIISFLSVDKNTYRLLTGDGDANEEFINRVVDLLYRKFNLIQKHDLNSGLQLAALFKKNESALKWLEITAKLAPSQEHKITTLRKFLKNFKEITAERLFPILECLDPERRIRGNVYGPLAWAAYCKNKAQIEEFVTLGLSIDGLKEAGKKSDFTPLMVAAQRGDYDFAKYLLEEQGADVDRISAQGYTALSYAVQAKNLKLVQYLIEERGASTDSKKHSETIVMLAAQSGDYDTTKYLLSHGLSAKDVTKGNKTVLMFAAQGNNLEVVKLIMNTFNSRGYSHAINRTENHFNGYNALLFAVESGSLPTVTYFLEDCLPVKKSALEKEKRLSVLDNNDNSALMIAAQFGHLSIVRYLIDQGADLQKVNKEGDNALLLAARYGHLDIVKLFLERGFSVNYTNKAGESALLLAAKEGHLEVVTYLREEEAASDIGNNWNQTALTLSVRNGRSLDLISYLCKHTNGSKDMALMYAAERGRLSVVEFLVSQGVDINKGDRNGNTALMRAAKVKLFNFTDPKLERYRALLSTNHLGVIKYLVSHGADIHKKNNQGQTAIDIARYNVTTDTSFTGILDCLTREYESKQDTQEQTSNEPPLKKQKHDSL